MSIKNELQHIIKTSEDIENLESLNYLDINYINKIVSDGRNYGKSNYGSGKKVNIGYFSCDTINLKKIIFSDILSNIMSFSGYDVIRDCYCNDSNCNKIKKELDNIRVSLDIVTSEEKLYSDGIVDNVLSVLQKSDKCYIKDNCLWLRTTDLYDSNDRLLVDDNGIYSSFLLYLCYHINRFDIGYDKIIDIVSDNDDEYISGIRSGIEFAGYDSDKLEIINVVKDNEDNYKLDFREMNSNVYVNNLRYFLIDNKLNMKLVEKNSMESPIYYIEKSYSRICLLLRGKSYENVSKYSTIDSDDAYTILNKLSKFEDVIIDSMDKRLPNLIASYLYELAILFNFYVDNNSDGDAVNERLLMLAAIRIVMDNASNILGIILREEI